MKFVTNDATAAADEVRIESLHGATHLVAPVVMVREGVLNGEFLSYDEIARSEPAWNGRPVTAPPTPENAPDGAEPSGHPFEVNEDGQVEFVSANQLPYLDTMAIGLVQNAEARTDLDTSNGEPSSKGLVAEVWVNVERAKSVGVNAKEVVRRLAEGESLEVSTGYFRRLTQNAGSFEGSGYEVEQFDLQPDHLAMLPNEKGACSWADGCGTPRANSDLAPNALDDVASAAGVSTERLVADGGTPAGDGDVQGNAQSTLERIRRLVGAGDSGAGGSQAAFCANCGTGGCGGDCGTHGHQTMKDEDIQALADRTAFSFETLTEWDEDRLATLDESVPAEGGDGSGGSDGGDGDGAGADTTTDGSTETTDGGNAEVDELKETVEDLTETVEALAAQNTEQERQVRRAYAEQVAAHTDHDADELVENTDEYPTPALETLAETVAPEATGYVGQAGDRVNAVAGAGATGGVGPTGNGQSDDEVEELTANVGALRAQDAAEGAD